jgi:hypothetical protein
MRNSPAQQEIPGKTAPPGNRKPRLHLLCPRIGPFAGCVRIPKSRSPKKRRPKRNPRLGILPRYALQIPAADAVVAVDADEVAAGASRQSLKPLPPPP